MYDVSDILGERLTLLFAQIGGESASANGMDTVLLSLILYNVSSFLNLSSIIFVYIPHICLPALSITRLIYLLYKETFQPIIKFISTPPRHVLSQGKWVVLSNIIGKSTGEAFARHLAEEGCNIIVLGIKSRELDGFVSDLDKLGFASGHRTRIEAVAWNVDADGDGNENDNDSEFWTRVGKLLGNTITDDGLGLVVHCCSNVHSSASSPAAAAARKSMNSSSSLSSASADIMGTESYSRQLISAALPRMTFRNQGAIICISSDGDGEPYPDRNDLIDCSPACAAYTRALVQSLYNKYRPLGIDCLSVLQRVSRPDVSSFTGFFF